ncbi:hypothetical protein LDENG_00271500 [Lucifuga dentata]|nr:hypothetical protein LDENG_00271500 [Lucifuga dentata]
MWQVLKNKYKLNGRVADVMRLLAEINPSGTEARRCRRFAHRTYHSLGPNYIWHADGYDKMKPFGFALSGCMDGFSRKILWLSCGPTNNNPAVIANNFIDCVRSLGVVLQHLKTDCGTENGTMAAIQCTLCAEHTDYHAGLRSHMYGSSVNDQWIEAWWSSFRRGRAQFWIDSFGDLQEYGLFNGSHEHKSLLFSQCPAGIPEELYSLPHRYAARDCGFPVEQDLAMFETGQTVDSCGDPEMHDYLQQVMVDNNYQHPNTWTDTVDLYIKLKEITGL